MAWLAKDDEGQFYTREGERVPTREEGDVFDDIADLFETFQSLAIESGEALPVAALLGVEVTRSYGNLVT